MTDKKEELKAKAEEVKAKTAKQAKIKAEQAKEQLSKVNFKDKKVLAGVAGGGLTLIVLLGLVFSGGGEPVFNKYNGQSLKADISYDRTNDDNYSISKGRALGYNGKYDVKFTDKGVIVAGKNLIDGTWNDTSNGFKLVSNENPDLYFDFYEEEEGVLCMKKARDKKYLCFQPLNKK